jgi:hypothetical protein
MGIGGDVVRAGQSPAVVSMGASVDVGGGSALGAFDRAVSSSVRCFRILALGGFLEPAGDRESAVLRVLAAFGIMCDDFVADEESNVSLVLEPREDITRSFVEKLSDRRTLIGGSEKKGV